MVFLTFPSNKDTDGAWKNDTCQYESGIRTRDRKCSGTHLLTCICIHWANLGIRSHAWIWSHRSHSSFPFLPHFHFHFHTLRSKSNASKHSLITLTLFKFQFYPHYYYTLTENGYRGERFAVTHSTALHCALFVNVTNFALMAASSRGFSTTQFDFKLRATRLNVALLPNNYFPELCRRKRRKTFSDAERVRIGNLEFRCCCSESVTPIRRTSGPEKIKERRFDPKKNPHVHRVRTRATPAAMPFASPPYVYR